MNLATPLRAIKGVGEKTAEQFHISGLDTVEDLIQFLPRKYEDFSEVVSIDQIQPGKQTIKARCVTVSTRIVKRGMKITTATLADETGRLQAVWFNQPYRATQLKDSDQVFYFSGDFQFNYNKYQLANASVEKISDMPVQTDRFLPVYRSIKGLKSQVVRKVLHELRPFMTMLPDHMPQDIIHSEKLLDLGSAISAAHFPKTSQDVATAKERLAFDELFELLLAAQLNKRANATLDGWSIPFEAIVVRDLVQKLPFELTGAQRKSTWDILQDMEAKVPMNRLLQGDVGAGKTVIAAIAARQAASHGYQTAVLAPTEILASQHAKGFDDLLRPFGVRVAFLAGSVKQKQRVPLLESLANGDVDIIVGTHALLEPVVRFNKLGLVVVDEQHRFGVNQRQELLKKSKNMPHMLAMTATPIPRSLALTLYGELDVSIVSEKPRNRLPIQTKIVSPVSRSSVYKTIDSEIARGRQAYVICKLIDDSAASEAKSVEAEYSRLQNSIFGHRKMGILHGRMKPDDKDAVMQKFARHELDILVSTTVVEVGVDVPNATVIMIEDADQYGLSQLHQLRGRVGRSSMQSYCYLMTSDTNKPSERLRQVEQSNDGFYLAEVDLKLRGPGEIYGRAQHGALNLQVATLGDTRMIARVQRAVERFLDTKPDLLQYKQLMERVQYYQRVTTLN